MSAEYRMTSLGPIERDAGHGLSYSTISQGAVVEWRGRSYAVTFLRFYNRERPRHERTEYAIDAVAQDTGRTSKKLAGILGNSGELKEFRRRVQENAELPVIFRKSRGEVTAIFPTLPADRNGNPLTAYAHLGQHCGASWGWYRGTRKAQPEEYAPLLAELRAIYDHAYGPGDTTYSLRVYPRMTPQHRKTFNAEVERLRNA